MNRGAKISAVLTPTHYRQSVPLAQGDMEIPYKVTVDMSKSLKNTHLTDQLMEFVKTLYSEPHSPIVLGSFLALKQDWPKVAEN